MDIRLPLQPSRSGRASSKAAALAVLATAQLVIALDYSIVNVALPDIGRSLGFTGGTVQWVISAYTLTFGGFLLLGGRAADLLGRRRMFMAALSLFGLASLAGGLAQHAGLLIAARAVQGIGGAVLFPATLSLVNTTFEEGRERNRAIAVWGSAGAGGLSLGVLAGGVLTGVFGWPAVFFVNVPIVAALLALAPLVLPAGRPSSAARRFDLPGALLVTLGAMRSWTPWSRRPPSDGSRFAHCSKPRPVWCCSACSPPASVRAWHSPPCMWRRAPAWPPTTRARPPRSPRPPSSWVARWGWPRWWACSASARWRWGGRGSG